MSDEDRKPTVLIFAGAGASKAVSPEKYPTTLEFFERLPERIQNDVMFTEILSFLRTTMGSNTPVDIEMLLWRLEELKSFLEQAVNSRCISGWFMNNAKLTKVVDRGQSSFGSLTKSASLGINALTRLESEINKQVYDFYSSLPQRKQLEENWIPLLGPLLKAGIRVELVTTNYDLVLETLVAELRKEIDVPILTGWGDGIYRELDLSFWQTARAKTSGCGMLTKLHGSVNWARNNETLYASDPLFKGAHERHAIIYPGFKGRPDDPVFQSFHQHFARALNDASAILFIGFAFRDEHVNDLCERHLSRRAKVICLNPESNLPLPFADGRVARIKENFDIQTATKASSFLVAAVG